VLAILAVASLTLADDHKKNRSYFQKYKHEDGDQMLKGILGGRHDEGNEATGQIAAWSLGAVNLTVAISLLIRGMKRFIPLTPAMKSSMTQFNNFQKKHLMRFHYWLNPVLLGVAILHWTLSKCASTSLTEWGLLIMSVTAALGIVLKFKLISKTSLRRVYKLHTQPVIFLSLICLIVMGHLLMD